MADYPPLTADDWHTITGQGLVATVSQLGDDIVQVGQTVEIDGELYRIRDIEVTRILTNPPIIRGYGLPGDPTEVRPGRAFNRPT